MNQKRIRSLNWDEEEKKLLRSVIKEYVHIIENKSLDTKSNKTKIKAWGEVYKKFNEFNSRHRHLNQLKIQWKTMKINARKAFGTFKSKVKKTGGGQRLSTPDDTKLEIKYLLNSAELLRDHNEYDSDGLIPCSSNNEIKSTGETCALPSKHSKTTNYVVEPITDNIENQQIAVNVGIVKIEDVDVQDDAQEFTDPLVLSQDDKISNPTTPITTTTAEKMVPERNLMLNTNEGKHLKSQLDRGDYDSSMISQSKMLKDKEHIRRMEMAEEEHAIAMSIQKEKLKCAILEREILELKKAREEKYNIFNNKEHIRRMELAEEEHAIAMSTQEGKLKCAILEREILELKKAREDKYNIFNK